MKKSREELIDFGVQQLGMLPEDAARTADSILAGMKPLQPRAKQPPKPMRAGERMLVMPTLYRRCEVVR